MDFIVFVHISKCWELLGALLRFNISAIIATFLMLLENHIHLRENNLKLFRSRFFHQGWTPVLNVCLRFDLLHLSTINLFTPQQLLKQCVILCDLFMVQSLILNTSYNGYEWVEYIWSNLCTCAVNLVGSIQC